jgi:hypothetical protein
MSIMYISQGPPDERHRISTNGGEGHRAAAMAEVMTSPKDPKRREKGRSRDYCSSNTVRSVSLLSLTSHCSDLFAILSTVDIFR